VGDLERNYRGLIDGGRKEKGAALTYLLVKLNGGKRRECAEEWQREIKGIYSDRRERRRPLGGEGGGKESGGI